MVNKKIMILGASILQVPAIIKSKEMGIYAISVDIDPDAIGFKYADEYHVVSTIDTEKILELARRINPDGIITLASDKPMLTVAKVGEELGLNTISIETSIKVTNKARMRESLESNDVPIPKFKVVSSYKEYIDATDKFGDKFIVKPADNSGSRGVFLLEDRKQLRNAYEYSSRYSSTGEVLIEEFLDGPEISVESITIDGKTKIIAITDKDTTGSPHFVELGHTIPSMLNEEIKLKVKDITKKAIDALKINIGPSHTEIKITSEGPKIIEVGARLGGDNITTHLVPLATGVDILKNVIEMALNLDITKYKLDNNAASIKYLTVKCGKIKSIDGIDNANKIDGIKQVTLTKGVGDYISGLNSSSDRVGFVISKGNNFNESKTICSKAINMINIEV